VRPPAVATVGRLEVSPGSITTVPDEARLLVDLRDASLDGQAHLAAFAYERAGEIAGRRGLTASVHTLATQRPVPLDPSLRTELAHALTGLNTPFVELSSGASHDAAQMATLAPVAMLFVPSRGGTSHAPSEWSDVHDIARGVDAIAAAVASLDR
jgi:allantoate deiminase